MFLERLAELPVESGAQLGERLDERRRNRLAGPAPQHRAQLVVDVEAHAVVDPVDMPPGRVEDMAALAVGVVEHRVQHGQPGQPQVVGVRQRVRVPVVVARRRHREPAGRHVVRGHETDQRLRVVGLVDPQLDGAHSERPVPQDRRRHQVPPGRVRHQVRRHLTPGQRAVREVPERPLAADRLVDAAPGQPVQRDLGPQRGVRGVDEASLELHRAAGEQFEGVLLRQHRCGLRSHRW